MRRKQAFTLIELLVVISIIALLVGILLPALGAARRTARNMQNSTQVRGLHQSMVIFAQNNNTWYPGYNEEGKVLQDSTNSAQVAPWGTPPEAGYHPAARFREMLDDRQFEPDYLISPHERKTRFTNDAAPLTTQHYSYALLMLSDGGIRTDEWRETQHSKAVVISDRGIDNGSGAIRSVAMDPDSGVTDWKGSIGYNDNHVDFEPSQFVDTKYGTEQRYSLVTDDNLFAEEDGRDIDGNTVQNGDAAMVYEGPADFIDD